MLERTAGVIAAYRDGLPRQQVVAASARADVVEQLSAPLPDGPTPLDVVFDELVSGAEPGLTAVTGPRYFGFVVGGSIDAALLGDLLTSGWDQNAFNEALAPGALAFEDVAGRWLKELLGLPDSASVGFVDRRSGGEHRRAGGRAVARAPPARLGRGADGLTGAPHVRVLAGAERHATIDRSLRLARARGARARGGSRDAAGRDGHRRTRAALASNAGRPTIVCAQAGNVNTGACDDLRAVT